MADPGSLFLPVRAIWCDPAGLGSVDGAYCCHCDDSADYVIKDQKHHPRVPHSEWFCYRLGERVGIAAPQFKPVDIGGGDLVFGSRWESGQKLAKTWWEMVADGTIPFSDMSVCYSKIFAFDHFVHNIDRHASNYLCRPQHLTWILLPIDYSRSWLCQGWPLPTLPFAVNAKTRIVRKQLEVFLGQDLLDKTVSADTLSRIKTVKPDEVEGFILSHPQSWITASEKDAIVKWWKSADRTTRIDGILNGIGNGSYL
jgi:hypothetical protein